MGQLINGTWVFIEMHCGFTFKINYEQEDAEQVIQFHFH